MELVDKKLLIERLAGRTGLRQDTIKLMIEALEQDIREFFELHEELKVYEIGYLILSNQQMNGYNRELKLFYNEA